MMSRIMDFSGLQWGKIHPTDIDGFIEFKDKLYIFIESKHGNAPLPTGQRLAFERLVDAIHNSGRISIGLVFSYQETADTVTIADLPVQSYRYRNDWHIPKTALTVRNAIEQMMSLL